MKSRFLTVLACLLLLTIGMMAAPKLGITRQQAEAIGPEEYNTLLQRFNIGDSTLTLEEVAKVYFGSPRQKGYTEFTDMGRINGLRAERRYGEVLPLALKALETDPINLTLLFRTYASAVNAPEHKFDNIARTAQTRLLQICDLIFASGDGVNEQTPFEVNSKADIEQFLTNYVQVERIDGISQMGPLTVALVKLPGRDEPAYLFFRATAK